MKRFKIVVGDFIHLAKMTIKSLPLQVFTKDITESVSITSGASHYILRRARRLEEMDDLSLNDFDNMKLDDVDYIPY